MFIVILSSLLSLLHSVTNEETLGEGHLQSISHNGKFRLLLSNIGKPSCSTTANRHLALSAKIIGTQRRTQVVHEAYIVCTVVYVKRHQ